jgi:hypothetical protein
MDDPNRRVGIRARRERVKPEAPTEGHYLYPRLRSDRGGGPARGIGVAADAVGPSHGVFRAERNALAPIGAV